MSTGVEPPFTLTEDGEWWIARDTEPGVTSQGRTRHTALDTLDEALADYRGQDELSTDDDPRAVGVDPERNDSEIFE